MKKNYAILGSALMVAVSALTANAQQLPNAGFEEDWSTCKPWTPNNNAKETGTTPSSWTISQVGGMGTTGMGATVVGEKCDGYNSASAVKLYNSPNSIASSQTVPGYLTLGTPWSTAEGTSAKNKDGGTFGGIEFAHRPDAVSFMYTRSHGTAKPSEQATVVAYLWKGTYTQADVPANIGLFSSQIKKVSMVDRERNILGMSTDQGGAVSSTDGAACIAKINYAITGDTSVWANKIIEFDYLTNDTPEKFNIIFAAGDYWTSDLGKNNTLCVDDVKLVYYSRLSALSVNGASVPSFANDTYEYTVDSEIPSSADAITYTLAGNAKSATVNVALDAANNKATVTVTNVDADIDGNSSHVYTINFTKNAGGDTPSDTPSATIYEGSLVIEMLSDVINPDDSTVYSVYITPLGNGKCNFLLPDFTLDFGDGPANFGDITVENCTMTSNADGSITYTGSKKGLSLLEGDIVADVTLNGTEDSRGHLVMNIPVVWEGIEINVDFNGSKLSSGVANAVVSDVNSPVEYYNLQGIRVNNPENGVYIRRQGNNVTKVLVK